MRKAIGLAMAGCLLVVGCKKGDSSDSVASSAPSCVAADDLLLKIDGINENVGMQEAFQTALQSLPDQVRDNAVNRINAKVASDGARMRAPEGGLRQWIALLLLSAKSEARAVEDFRYCNGDFDFGNGQRWHWVYSMSNGPNGSELRINSAEMTAGGSVTAAAQPAQTPNVVVDEVAADAPETGGEVPAENHDVAEEVAGEESQQAAAPAYDAQAAARERELERIAAERQQIARERRELAKQREQAAAQREAEAQAAARAEQERAWREQQEARRRPTADELYESRRGECPRGFLGTDCRRKIKEQVCAGHWSTNPEPGYSNCKSS